MSTSSRRASSAVRIHDETVAAVCPPIESDRDHAMPDDRLPAVNHRRIRVDGVDVFYREAGPADAPVVLLLHGFPTSSHMFRHLMPRLAGDFRVVAPDYPGFGFTNVPPERAYRYSFDALAATLDRFVDALGLTRFAMYVFDYGAPVGLRMAMARPERVAALITQNGNMYEEGLSRAWAPIRGYWEDPSPARRDALRGLLSLEGIRFQYTEGVANPERIAPETWTLDAQLLAREGHVEVQLDLIRDYASNLALYPAFQRWLRDSRTPVLAVWGRNDPFFLPAGAEAYTRDAARAEVHLLDTGHFALETHGAEIAGLMRGFLASLPGVPPRPAAEGMPSDGREARRPCRFGETRPRGRPSGGAASPAGNTGPASRGSATGGTSPDCTGRAVGALACRCPARLPEPSTAGRGHRAGVRPAAARRAGRGRARRRSAARCPARAASRPARRRARPGRAGGRSAPTHRSRAGRPRRCGGPRASADQNGAGGGSTGPSGGGNRLGR